jgi:hypothetical protein
LGDPGLKRENFAAHADGNEIEQPKDERERNYAKEDIQNDEVHAVIQHIRDKAVNHIENRKKNDYHDLENRRQVVHRFVEFHKKSPFLLFYHFAAF